MDWFSFKYPQKHYKEATLIVYILQKKKLRHRAVTWHTKLKTATSAKPVLKKKKKRKESLTILIFYLIFTITPSNQEPNLIYL